ncbi:MAG: hypothetical protein KFF49_04020 [Bacteroidales bacterium]|nr:hypothetical protein [Bacteroidales bacterium]
MIKFLAIYIVSLFMHPVHVSMSSMEYISGENGYSISVRMFSDDLLLDILSIYELPGDHIHDHVYKGPDELYEKYINERLEIRINGEKHTARLLQAEKLEIETIMRLFIDFKGEVDSIDISNTILTGIFMDQVNLFIYKDENNEFPIRFTFNHLSEKLNLAQAD